VTVFVTGGTGYMGRRLIPQLVARGHRVRALVRASSAARLPTGCAPVLGNALDSSSYSAAVQPADTFVHLVGVAHPSPAKAEEFRSVDLASVHAAVAAALTAGVGHFVYVSVAHPAPMMKAYIAARSEGEELIRTAALGATVLRPWYVLGPGHRWPVILQPFYWLAEQVPGSRESARRLGLVTIDQMLAALVRAVENRPDGVRIVEVPQIRAAV